MPVADSLVTALQQGVPGGLLADGAGADLGGRALLLLGLMATYVGALSLVPLPPLPGGTARRQSRLRCQLARTWVMVPISPALARASAFR